MKIQYNSLDEKSFAKDFLEQFLQKGFGTQTKTEIDLLVLDCLIKNGAWDAKSTDFNIANDLGISSIRVRNMRDKLRRRMTLDREKARMDLRQIIIRNEKWYEKSDQTSKGKIKLQIDDGCLREFAEDLIKHRDGIVDSSFNRSIIIMSGRTFISLVIELLGEDGGKTILEEINSQLSNDNKKSNSWDLFVESFVKSAGKEAGQKLIKIGFLLLTNGISEIVEIADSM